MRNLRISPSYHDVFNSTPPARKLLTPSHFYRPQRSCAGYVFTGVCLSTGGGGVCLSACWDTTPPQGADPPEADTPPSPGADTPGADTPLGADTLPEQTPPFPGSRTPQEQTPQSRHPPFPRSRPPGADTPQEQTPQSRHPPGADTPHPPTPPEQTPPRADTPGADTPPKIRSLLWTVRILLECILVHCTCALKMNSVADPGVCDYVRGGSRTSVRKEHRSGVG